MNVARWFAQTVPSWRPGQFKRAAFVRWNAWASRRAGRPLPSPERTPPEKAVRVARWLSEAAATGNPDVLFCTPSSAVRVCGAANEAGLPLAGTFFSLGGEPYTQAKARVIRDAGCRAESGYFMAEMGGPIAVACSHATEVDEAHIAADRIALIDIERLLPGGSRMPALYATTVSPRAPQVVINFETGDYALRGEPRCGCPFDQLGLAQTIHTIRSYEKLSTEGMHFFGPRLVTLLEDELPRRFGGGPTDYQLIEEEDRSGRSRISLVVSPRVTALDERDVVEVALSFLAAEGAAENMMAEIWNRGDTMRVVRREPVVSGASKVLPLHVAKRS
jgi:phenylacetate-coenzyme A ligase PaaK-like adenylate-forming protein